LALAFLNGGLAVAETIRAFISIEVPEIVKQRVDQLQVRLKASGGDVRWVRSVGLHVSLKFLGQVPSAKVPAIIESLETVVSHGHRPQISIGGIGAFPDLKNPRVVWVGLDADERLMRLQEGVENALEHLGFVTDERAFRPHLTVGRVRTARGRTALVRALEKEQNFSAGDYELKELCLMKSDLKSQGAVYAPLWSKEIPS
jgi:RNA 2',3'-cyclic 3'-phosphodiesterase